MGVLRLYAPPSMETENMSRAYRKTLTHFDDFFASLDSDGDGKVTYAELWARQCPL